MNILNKLTIKNLKLNRKRTIVTTIGIILSTALICCLAGLISSFQTTLINFVQTTEGDYHAIIEKVDKNDIKYIANNKQVSKYFNIEEVGYSKLSNSANENKPYLYTLAFDSVALKEIPLTVVKGRLPKNSNEIVISEEIIKNGKVNYKIGDTLTLEVGRRYLNGIELDQSNGYNEYYNKSTDEYISGDESFISDVTKTYKIVGIIEKPDDITEPYNAPGYSLITYMDSVVDNANVYVKYNKVSEYKDITKTLCQNEKYESWFHMELIRYQGSGLSDNNMAMFYQVGGIVVLIIIVTSIFVIKNSFSISVTEKIKQYGMLASIGATSKQIRKSVLFEGIIIGLIGVPLGILFGMFANIVLVEILNYILKDFLNGIAFIFHIPLMAVVLSIILAFITIILSAIIPSIKASKISPIEALRNSNEIKIKGKKLRTPKIIKKIFKVGGDISYKNLKRSKKKYRTTLISIVLSITVFISLSSILHYGFEVSGEYYANLSYNVSIYTNNDSSVKDDEIYKEISKLDYIDRYSIHHNVCLDIDTSKYASKEAIDNHFKTDLENGVNTLCAQIISVGDEEYNRFVKENNLTIGENTAILFDDGAYYDTESKRNLISMLNLKDNDKISGTIAQDEKARDITLNTIRVNKVPMGLEYVDNAVFLIVSDDYLNSLGKYPPVNMFVHASDIDKFIKTLKPIEDKYGNLSVNNIDDFTKANNAIVLIVKIFLYGFITVISLIGVTNIFNTITTNMMLRRREFATLRAIGMTNKEFNRMIRLESIFYGIKALLIGLPLGIGLSYLLYLGFNEGMGIKYILPTRMIIICIVFVFLIIFLTMMYSLKKINKQNIIETIREENI